MRNKNGFLALSLILIILAVVSAIVVSVSLMAIGEGKGGLFHYYGTYSLSLAEACMEDALLKFRTNPSYTGGTINFPQGSCNVTVSLVSGAYRVTTTFTYKNSTRTIEAAVTRTSKLNLSSWKEK
jgi:hypothetical protein